MRVITLLSQLHIRMTAAASGSKCIIDVDLFRPKRLLEQIKGISEQKATKILVECKSALTDNTAFLVELSANGFL